MPHRATGSPDSADSHSSAAYSNACRASAKRTLKQSQSQPFNSQHMARSDASSEEERSPRVNGKGKGKKQAVSESESEVEVSEDGENDSEATKMHKRTAREGKARANLRQKYRRLQATADGYRGDLGNTSIDALDEVVKQANKTFDKVQAPAEAVLDSRVLIATSEAGALKARQLKIDADAFDTDEFLIRLTHFMGGSVGAGARAARRNRRAAQDDSDDEMADAGEKPWAWGKVGKVLSGESKRPPILDHMYGPLQLEVKEKKARTQRQKQKIDESQKMRPEELHAEDVAKNENETGKVTARIAKNLAKVAGTEGIPYLKFIINPDSFSQTVENMFYFSFLVREQKVALEVDDDADSPWYEDMIAYVVSPESAAQTLSSNQIVKHQVVLELTQEVWKEAIEAYDITESMIPTRDAFSAVQTHGGKKWS